jgi:hypothetical protein
MERVKKLVHSYRAQAESMIERESELQSLPNPPFFTIVRPLFARLALGREIDPLRPAMKRLLEAPLPEHSLLVRPAACLSKGVVALLSGERAGGFASQGLELIPQAEQQASEERQRALLSGQRVALSLLSGNDAKAHAAARMDHAPVDPLCELSLLAAGQGETARTRLDAPLALEAMVRSPIDLLDVGAAGLLGLSEMSTEVLANNLRTQLERVESDLWRSGDPYRSRANYFDRRWQLRDGELRAIIEVTGSGGPLADPAPLLVPAMAVFADLDLMAIGELPTGNLEGPRSRKKLQELLAEERTIAVRYQISGDLALEIPESDPWFLRTGTRWLQHRHSERFRGRVVIEAPAAAS